MRLRAELRLLASDLRADLADLWAEYRGELLAGAGLVGLLALGLIAQALER